MSAEADRALNSFCGSRARLLTLSVLAAAEAPLTGYRVAEVAGLSRAKVYPELRKALAVGIAARTASGYTLIDSDLRELLRKRVRITWNTFWDAPDRLSTGAVDRELEKIRNARRKVPIFDPDNRIPKKAVRELQRDPEKDRVLMRLGLRPSVRKRT